MVIKQLVNRSFIINHFLIFRVWVSTRILNCLKTFSNSLEHLWIIANRLTSLSSFKSKIPVFSIFISFEFVDQTQEVRSSRFLSYWNKFTTLGLSYFWECSGRSWRDWLGVSWLGRVGDWTNTESTLLLCLRFEVPWSHIFSVSLLYQWVEFELFCYLVLTILKEISTNKGPNF